MCSEYNSYPFAQTERKREREEERERERKCTQGTKHVEIAREWSGEYQVRFKIREISFPACSNGEGERRVNGEWKEFVIAGSRSKKSMKPIRGHKSWFCEEGGKINVLPDWR